MALYVKQGAAGAYIKGATSVWRPKSCEYENTETETETENNSVILTGYLFRASLFRIE